MPTYEYQCKSCNHRFEIWQKMSDEPLTVCPECGGIIRRILFPAGIVFKGSGFYKTDHGNGMVANENSHAAQSETKEDAPRTESGNGNESKTGSAQTTTSTSTPASESKVSAAAD